MSTVIVVGAGGSLAQAISYRPQRNLEHPPLDGDFFSRATTLAQHNTQIRARIAAVRTAIAASPDSYDPWQQGSLTMEQFFADIYYAVASGGQSPRALRVFVETMRLYRRVLAQTTNWMTSVSRLGEIDRLVRHELSRLTETMTLVTFNHDLLIESVAAKMPRAAGKWCLRSLYGDIDLRSLNWPAGRRHENHVAGCQHDPPFQLLKLHGSLNWLMRSANFTPTASTLFPPQRSNRVIYSANRSDIQIDPMIRATARPGGRSWYLWPLVVPPIYDKQRITGMRVLQQVWDRAYKAIEVADRLILFGYSIPDGDVLARQMLRTAVRQNTKLKCVDCINPDPSIVVKLRQVLDLPVIRMYSDMKSFVEHS